MISIACMRVTGVLAYYLLTSQYPFDGPSTLDQPETRREETDTEQLDLILHSIVHDEAQIDVPALRPFSATCKSFLLACLKVRVVRQLPHHSEASGRASDHSRSLHR
jgi:hypothetical protein